MAKILCVDGKYRQFIPAEKALTLNKFDFVQLSKNDVVSKYIRKQAYCHHCRKELGFIDIKSDEARQHVCDKLYNHINQIKRNL